MSDNNKYAKLHNDVRRSLEAARGCETKRVCPNAPGAHTTFYAPARVLQTWEVDGDGQFLREESNDITAAHPQHAQEDEEWTCATCGATAVAFDDPYWLEKAGAHVITYERTVTQRYIVFGDPDEVDEVRRAFHRVEDPSEVWPRVGAEEVVEDQIIDVECVANLNEWIKEADQREKEEVPF